VRICPGWEGPASRLTNARLSVRIGITDGGVLPRVPRLGHPRLNFRCRPGHQAGYAFTPGGASVSSDRSRVISLDDITDDEGMGMVRSAALVGPAGRWPRPLRCLPQPPQVRPKIGRDSLQTSVGQDIYKRSELSHNPISIPAGIEHHLDEIHRVDAIEAPDPS